MHSGVYWGLRLFFTVVMMYFVYQEAGSATAASVSVLFLWVEALIWGNEQQTKRIKALEAAIKGETDG